MYNAACKCDAYCDGILVLFCVSAMLNVAFVWSCVNLLVCLCYAVLVWVFVHATALWGIVQCNWVIVQGCISDMVHSGCTGQLEIIRHQQLSDTLGLYDIFLHTGESHQFRRRKGHPSKSQNMKKETSKRSRNWHANLKQR